MTPLPFQFGLGVPTLLWEAVAVVLAVAVVVLVGRVLLSVAWRLVTIAAVLLAVLLAVALVVPGLL